MNDSIEFFNNLDAALYDRFYDNISEGVNLLEMLEAKLEPVEEHNVTVNGNTGLESYESASLSEESLDSNETNKQTGALNPEVPVIPIDMTAAHEKREQFKRADEARRRAIEARRAA